MITITWPALTTICAFLGLITAALARWVDLRLTAALAAHAQQLELIFVGKEVFARVDRDIEEMRGQLIGQKRFEHLERAVERIEQDLGLVRTVDKVQLFCAAKNGMSASVNDLCQ